MSNTTIKVLIKLHESSFAEKRQITGIVVQIRLHHTRQAGVVEHIRDPSAHLVLLGMVQSADEFAKRSVVLQNLQRLAEFFKFGCNARICEVGQNLSRIVYKSKAHTCTETCVKSNLDDPHDTLLVAVLLHHVLADIPLAVGGSGSESGALGPKLTGIGSFRKVRRRSDLGKLRFADLSWNNR